VVTAMSQSLRHVKVKICFPYSTIRALPVFWYIFPECPWGKAIVWQALGLVIDETANHTLVLLVIGIAHIFFSLKINLTTAKNVTSL
jgi:hypothetical protein